MKNIVLLCIAFVVTAYAQATATRNVDLSWTASGSNGVTGYNVLRGATAAGPFTQLNSTLLTGTTYVDATAQVGQTYTYQVVAVAPDCTPTTPVTTACGTSPPAFVSTTVPPLPAVTITVTVTVP